jgi:hypothetical protein
MHIKDIFEKAYDFPYKIYDWIYDEFYYSYIIPRLAIKIISCFYRIKDNNLSNMLHNFAGLYQRRPQEGWIAAKDWACWKE